MNLVLYSKLNPDINLEDMYRINLKFLDMINKKDPSIGYIASETDRERVYFKKTQNFYEKIGINDIFYFDLEDEYDPKNEEKLFKCDVIHLASGNTYKFLSLIQKRGIISKIQEFAENGGIIAGASAGALIVSPTIGSAQFGDENEVGLVDLKALNLVDFEIMPHWNIWPFYLEGLKKYSKDNDVTIYTVEDGNGIVIENDKIEFYGNIGRVEKGVYSFE